MIGTYPPTKCGIAEYTKELTQSLMAKGVDVDVVAVNQDNIMLNYPKNVVYVIRRDIREDYIKLAKFVNTEDYDVVHIQHEFGIFGGEWGSYIIDFMKRIKVPVITTLHTVLPSNAEIPIEKPLKKVIKYSDLVTVMNYSSLNILRNDYGIDTKKITVVPHGIRTIYLDKTPREIREELGIDGYFILLTIGLISPNKGIEYAIKALPKILKYNDKVLYLIVGETHPKLKAIYGESYREKLKRLARELGVEDKVVFINKFLTKEEYIKYIIASDVVILPYLDKYQVSSGSLSYAIGYGKVVISTPFLYALEVLSNGRGLLCRFRDPNSIARAVIVVMKNPKLKAMIEAKALEYGLKLRWEAVSESLLKVYKRMKEVILHE